MNEMPLEERVAVLERQMTELLNQPRPEKKKDWRNTIGMFTGDPVMKEIQEEGRKIREADREKAKNDLA